ncbi:hypothetical protein SLEP1_g21958 [Rubroshorea leprosula]|uniref:Uncharacterized protein n=1 Tax=Rubroshorea leprosula TaxID=152421 RepID=A0AAV5JDN1_9ROSI|nr:hypothetical protein SLEP1_g21958 [Rubroshorea leprosula]
MNPLTAAAARGHVVGSSSQEALPPSLWKSLFPNIPSFVCGKSNEFCRPAAPERKSSPSDSNAAAQRHLHGLLLGGG